MKSINTKYEDQWKYTSKIIKNKAFTLVELIIVITILAILATIAFISFRNYSWNARDGNKLTTLSNIEKWLTLYSLKTGNYPNPDDVYGTGVFSWTLLGTVWYVWKNITTMINMNQIPRDPIVEHEYTYWLSNDKRYYQLWAVLETSQTSFVSQTYAANYISKVVWNYKWLITFSTWWVKYITNLPSLVFTQTGIQNFEDTWNNPKFVINNGWNLVKPYDTNNTETIETTLKKLTQTWWIQLRAEPMPWNIDEWNSQSGTLKEQLWYSEDEIWGVIYGEKYYTDKQNISWWTSSSSSSSSSSGWPTICTSFTYSAWGPCQVGDTQTRTIETQSPSWCTGWSPESLQQSCTYTAPNTPPTVVSSITNVEQNEWTALNISMTWKFSDPEWGALNYSATNLPSGISINETTWSITGTLPNVASDTPYTITLRATDVWWLYAEQNFTITVKNISQWKDEPGTSCNNDDYVFTYNGPLNGNTSKTYRWAWCNSVLWAWFERGKQSNGSDGTISGCYSYNSTNTVWNCPIATSWNAMYSTKTEYDWNTTKGTNNIWWKLYTYAQASATTNWACPSGWHLPTDTEWEILETYLNTTVKVSPRIECRASNCPWLWWLGNTSKNTENNMIQALKIPLAGNRNTDEVTFSNRGNLARLWSSGASTRYFYWDNDAVYRYTGGISNGFSVRCIKD